MHGTTDGKYCVLLVETKSIYRMYCTYIENIQKKMGANWRILKLALKKINMTKWIRVFWLRTWTRGGGACECSYEALGSIKCGGKFFSGRT